MAEIFIPTDDSTAQVDGLLRDAREMAQLSARAAWELWLHEQSDTVRALAAEWARLRGVPFRFARTLDRRHRKLFVCSSTYGYHESYQSHEHALFLMVDAHRTREEDKASSTDVFLKNGGTVRSARRAAAQMARELRSKHPDVHGEEWDALYLAALSDVKGRSQ